jgi:hypothetical protein
MFCLLDADTTTAQLLKDLLTRVVLRRDAMDVPGGCARAA